MTTSLIERFTYGQAPQTVLFREITVDSPKRQQEMIALAKQQITAQKAATQEIVQSNLAGSKMLASEIAQQTSAMEDAMHQVGSRLSDDVSSAADRVSDEIGLLGDRLCGVLYELQWQLVQQHETLKDILYVLHNSRNNEAQQLVRQGIRHYVSEEYQEAEERFKRALKYDTTDYQVLMNLAYIEIHKNEASNAFLYFNKALKLPENLDSISKSRTLWAIARLFYAEKDFEKAFAYAEQALQYDGLSNPKGIFLSGVYAALAGKTLITLQRIEQGITLNSALFATAAVDPDLKIIRSDVLALLSRMSAERLHEATGLSNEVKKSLTQVKTTRWSSEYSELVRKIHGENNKLQNVLKKASYSDCLRCLENIEILRKAISEINELDRLYGKKHTLAGNIENREREHQKLRAELPSPTKKPSDFSPAASLSFYISFYILTCCYIAIERAMYINSLWGWLGIIFWVFWAFWLTIFYFLSSDANSANLVGPIHTLIKGVGLSLTTLLIWNVVVWIFKRKKENKRQAVELRREYMESTMSSISSEISKAQKTIAVLEEEARKYVSSASRRLTEIRWDAIGLIADYPDMSVSDPLPQRRKA